MFVPLVPCIVKVVNDVLLILVSLRSLSVSVSRCNPIETFAQMAPCGDAHIKGLLLRNIENSLYKEPTPIQMQVRDELSTHVGCWLFCLCLKKPFFVSHFLSLGHSFAPSTKGCVGGRTYWFWKNGSVCLADVSFTGGSRTVTCCQKQYRKKCVKSVDHRSALFVC